MSENKDQASKYAAFERLTGDAMSKNEQNKQKLNAEYGVACHDTIGEIDMAVKATMYDRLVDENDSLIRTLNDVGAILKLGGDDSMKLALIKTRITV